MTLIVIVVIVLASAVQVTADRGSIEMRMWTLTNLKDNANIIRVKKTSHKTAKLRQSKSIKFTRIVKLRTLKDDMNCLQRFEEVAGC